MSATWLTEDSRRVDCRLEGSQGKGSVRVCLHVEEYGTTFTNDSIYLRD